MVIIMIYYADIGYETNFILKYISCLIFSVLMLYDFCVFIPVKDKTL